jgi:deoxyribose-phosphate aldolase
VTNLKGSSVVVAAVVGFHEGTQDTYEKLREARAAVAAGASELDLVLNHSLLTKHNRAQSPPVRSHDSAIDSTIYRELASIRSLCPGVVIKLILETSQLDARQILAASHLAAAANLDFIKTSTGFNGPGASLPNVQLMVAAAEYLAARGVGSRQMQVKASGGVRSLEDAVKMLEAGATRLGTSSGLWIMQQARSKVEEAAGSVDGKERPGATRLYTDDSVAGGY